jgi:hypothetical protein
LILYENTAWVPITATAGGSAAREFLQTDRALRVPTGIDLSDGFAAALTDHTGYTSYRGDVPAGPLYLSESATSRWRLSVNGHSVTRSRAVGWANAFDVKEPGHATLTYRTSALRWLGVALQVALWALAIAFLVLTRRREVRIG